jgi:hydrogenase maturation protein HypF
MADFPLCPACQSEYGDPASRRFHAEPVACHDCGPRLSGSVAASAAAIGAGEIVALKGVGGYHLCCDARDEQAVARLRGAKRRDGKPLAVMVLNRASAAQWARLDAAALDRLESAERPVVIAETPVDTPAGTCSASADADRRAPTGPGTRAATATAPGLAAGVSRGLGTLGLMLPGTGLHYLLFHALLGRPDGRDWLDRANGLALVMTSANLSGEPLVIDAEAAERELGDIADRFLHHDREIAARVDDSVVRAVPGGGERPSASMLVRRARGYAPHAIGLSRDGPGVLALGPHLKTTLTMTRGDRAWLSPHIGDLESAAAIAFHRRAASLLESMLQDRPQLIACDLNPDYASSRLAESLAAGRGLPLVTVQHHHAHIAALLAEYRLEQPVLGLALDGHGLGWDGEAWGGELLRVDGARCERLGHLAALPLPGGDRAAREPWRMAAGALHTMGRGDEIARRFPEQPMAADLGRWLAAGAVSGTTAAGRLFDAAAGLLGVCQLSSFEGEAPMRLEALARGELEGSDQYRLDGGVLDFGPLLATLAEERDPARGARLFHGTLVRGLAAWAARAAGRAGIDTVALGGGCFLNARLAIELPRELRRAGLRPLLPRAVPPNDAAVSLGQAWVAQRTEI